MESKIDKVKVFEYELNKIGSNELRKFISYCVEQIPDYIFEVPASSTGKYHPSYALGKGGLIRHIKAACKIANELFVINDISDKNKDIIISALILHDSYKSGMDGGHTKFEHPIIASTKIRENFEDYPFKSECDIKIIDEICRCVESHMGQWHKSNYSNVVLPIPKNGLEMFVHQADYLASRKYLEVKFDEYYNPEDYIIKGE